MAIATVDQIRAQLNLGPDTGAEDAALLAGKLAAAQSLIERHLGFKIEERFGGEDQDPVPPDLAEAVLQLVAHWYENREAAGDGLREIPFGVSDIIAAHRDWSF